MRNFVSGYEIDVFVVLVLREVPTSFSDVACRRMYFVHELVQFSRRLMSSVVRDAELPARSDLSAWLRLKLADLKWDPTKRAVLGEVFAEHRLAYESAQDFDVALGHVEEVLLTLALNCLSLDGVTDPVCLAVSPFCPEQLSYGDEEKLLCEVQFLFDLLLAHGRVVLTERDNMMSGYLELLTNYRGCYDEPVVPEILVRTLLQLASADPSLQKLIRCALCLSGVGTMKGTVLEINNSCVDGVDGESFCRTVYSWCVANNVRSAASIPDGLVEEVKEVLTEVPFDDGDLRANMWSRVGRVGDADYRRDVLARLGFGVNDDTL